MKTFNPYINFSGNTRAALEFYKTCLNGDIVFLQTFGEAQQNLPNEQRDKVMHAEFRAEGIVIMASDCTPESPATMGDAISLSINLTDENEQTKIFNALADGGKITMPLEDTFWGARFGTLTDKFGVNWMLNCFKQQAGAQ